MTAPGICFVCGNIYPLLADPLGQPVVGGAEVQQLLLARGLQARGFAVSFITEDDNQGPETRAAGFRVLSFRLSWNKPLQALTLWRAMSRAGADIYYVRDMPKYGLLIFFFCRSNRRAIVQALASDAEAEPLPGSSGLNRLAMRVHAAWRRRADLVLAQTQHQAQRLRARWQTAARVVPNIVPVEPDGLEGQRPGDCFRVLWVGRMAPGKRFDQAAEIARRLPEMEFVVIGGRAREAPGYVDTVGEQIKDLRNVRWLGFVPYPQVGAYFQAAHVLLHTGEPGREGFPNVFLQAWAASIPVVSTGADPDGLLSKGGLGLLVANADEAVLALRRLAAAPGERLALGRRGHQYVWDTHRPEVVLPSLAEDFCRLIKRR